MEFLPEETLCEIFTKPTSLDDYLTLLESNENVVRVAQACVPELAPGPDEEIQNVPPYMILAMEKIEKVSPDYPISVDNLEQLVALARHKPLREATLDLSSIQDIRQPEVLTNYVSTFLDNFLVNKSPKATRANGPHFEFTFLTSLEPPEFIQVGGNHFFTNLAEEISYHELYQYLSVRIPLNKISMKLGFKPLDFYNFPNLKTVIINEHELMARNMKYLEFINEVGVKESPLWMHMKAMLETILGLLDNTKAEEYYYNFLGDGGEIYKVFFTYLMDMIVRSSKSYPHPRIFIPFGLELKNFFRMPQPFPTGEFFPNLKELILYMSDVTDCWKCVITDYYHYNWLKRLDRIILYVPISEDVDIAALAEETLTQLINPEKNPDLMAKAVAYYY